MSAAKPLPDQDRLNELFHYDPETGVLKSRVDRYKWRIGKEVGAYDAHGYRQITIDGVNLKVHRIIWKMVYGADPADFIDHIDGRKDNNRISNLRVLTNSQNNTNRKKPGGKNLFNGIEELPPRNDGTKRYRAYIDVRYKRYGSGVTSLGRALAWRKAAEKRYQDRGKAPEV